ncbi:MAG: alpha-L-rhamnosidase N-terminal domain-containing protein [bacterium]
MEKAICLLLSSFLLFAIPTGEVYTLSNRYFSLKGRNGDIEELKIDPKGEGNHSILLAKRIYLGEINPAELPEKIEWQKTEEGILLKNVPIFSKKAEGGIGINKEWNDPVQLMEGHTLGQDFLTDMDGLVAVSVPCPTWRTKSADMTLILRKNGPGGEIIARKRFFDVGDNSWQTLYFPPQPKGRYYLEMSQPKGTIGWWGRRDDIYPNGSAFLDGQKVEGDRFIRFIYADVKRSDLKLSLKENTLTLEPMGKLSIGFKFIAPWERDGYDVSASPFWAFLSDRAQYIPIHQFKRRVSLDFGMNADEWIEAKGQKGFRVLFLDPYGIVNFTMDAQEMTLHFPNNPVKIQVFAGKGDVPAFFPRFSSSDPRFDEVLNQFLWERALSWPPGPNNPDWMEWLSRVYNWMDIPRYLSAQRNHLLSYKMDPDGYVWTWGNQRCWPFPPCPPYDSRHFTTNSNYILACWRYYSWTKDNDFLRQNMGRIRKAMEWQLEYCKGKEGLFIDNSPDHDGTTKGVHSNYWDDIPFGYKSAYENIYFYASLEAMAQLEEVVRREGIKVEGDVPAHPPEYYRELAKEVKRNYNETFWNNEAGRYIGCVDITGARHDYGFTYVNLEALTYGLGDEEKARRIFHWLDTDPSDTYKYKFAPRANTIDCSGWWYLEGKAEIPAQKFDTHLENGGAILYTSFFDLMARAKYLGADNAFARLLAILDRYQKPDKLCGGPPLYYGENNGWQVGTDIPFPESGLVPCFFLYGIMGIDADIEGLRIQPNLPSHLSFAEVKNLIYRGLPLDIKVTPTSVEITCRKKGYEFHIKEKIVRGGVYYLKELPRGLKFPSFPPPSDWRAYWVWYPEANSKGEQNVTFFFRKRFHLPEEVKSARVWITADDAYTLYINGKLIGSDGRWEEAERYDVAKILRKGENIIAVEAYNGGGPGGLLCELEVELKSGKKLWIVSDKSWKVERERKEGWMNMDFDDEGWTKVEELGMPPAGWGEIRKK